MAPQSVEIARNATGNGAALANAKKAGKRAKPTVAQPKYTRR
jgi:hypothetical protein